MRWVFLFSPQKNRVKDFREAIIKYLEAMMESQQQVCKLLLCREESVGAIFSGAPCTRKLVKLGALVNSEIEAKSTVPTPLCHPLFHVHFHIAHNTPSLPTRKIWISIVFNLSWDKCDTQEKWAISKLPKAFQDEAQCKAIVMKKGFHFHANKLTFTRKVLQSASF